MAEQSKLPNWVKEHQKKIEETPRGDYFKFPEGETVITVDMTKPPVEIVKFNKNRTVYNITVNGKEVLLECGVQLDGLIINALMNGLNPMTVIRAGTNINTQYSIKGLK